MGRCWLIAIVAGAMLSNSLPSYACAEESIRNLDYLTYARAVVVGQITDRENIPGEELRRKILENPNLAIESRTLYENSATFAHNYTRFDITASEVIFGEAPDVFSVTALADIFGDPNSMRNRTFLIALHDSASPTLPIPSATISSNLDPSSRAVLQQPCSAPFIFENDSAEARTIRRMFPTRSR